MILGLVAKILIEKTLEFTQKDIFMSGGLLCLWFFFNLILETKHKYSFRSKSHKYLFVIPLVIALLIGISYNALTLVFILTSTILVFVYLQKNRNPLLGGASSFIRGLIQMQYFLYALMFYTNSIELNHIILSTFVFLIYSVRAIVGDVRDYKHNKEANKRTLVVSLGISPSIVIILILNILAIFLLSLIFDIIVSLPLILFSVAIIFYRNGYVLHQLFIFVTTFISINLIFYLLGQNLIFSNIIFFGIFLNMIFYPLLERKSNPEFL
jgi:4-hydroxybenzoate polyprenyltransferase